MQHSIGPDQRMAIDINKAKIMAQFLENWGRGSLFPQQQFIEAANMMRHLVEFYEDHKDEEVKSP
jgi:hypothetical protein